MDILALEVADADVPCIASSERPGLWQIREFQYNLVNGDPCVAED